MFQVMQSATRWHPRSSGEEMAPVHLSLVHLQTRGWSTLCQPGQAWNPHQWSSTPLGPHSLGETDTFLMRDAHRCHYQVLV